MAIGTVWADDTWGPDTWADGTWADAGEAPPEMVPWYRVFVGGNARTHQVTVPAQARSTRATVRGSMPTYRVTIQAPPSEVPEP